MGRAQRNPSAPRELLMDFASIYPSYNFCPTGKSIKPVNPFVRKNPACPHGANQWHFSARLTRQEGRVAIVTKRAVGCGGRGSVGVRRNRRAGLSRERYRQRRTTAPKRTAKACGSGTRCWCQVGGGFASPTGFAKPLIRR